MRPRPASSRPFAGTFSSRCPSVVLLQASATRSRSTRRWSSGTPGQRSSDGAPLCRHRQRAGDFRLRLWSRRRGRVLLLSRQARAGRQAGRRNAVGETKLAVISAAARSLALHAACVCARSNERRRLLLLTRRKAQTSAARVRKNKEQTPLLESMRRRVRAAGIRPACALIPNTFSTSDVTVHMPANDRRLC